jgi:hypothetical protein
MFLSSMQLETLAAWAKTTGQVCITLLRGPGLWYDIGLGCA